MFGMVELDRAGVGQLLSPQGELGMGRKKITDVIQLGIRFDDLDIHMAFRALIVGNLGENWPAAMFPVTLHTPGRRGRRGMMVRPGVAGRQGLIADRSMAGVAAKQSFERLTHPLLSPAAIL